MNYNINENSGPEKNFSLDIWPVTSKRLLTPGLQLQEKKMLSFFRFFINESCKTSFFYVVSLLFYFLKLTLNNWLFHQKSALSAVLQHCLAWSGSVVLKFFWCRPFYGILFLQLSCHLQKITKKNKAMWNLPNLFLI